MENIYSGRAWVFGDNINTDIISPPQYMELSIEDSAKYCMNAIRPEFSANVKKGDILVAGDNMGPGSSRETSPLTLKYLENVRHTPCYTSFLQRIQAKAR